MWKAQNVYFISSAIISFKTKSLKVWEYRQAIVIFQILSNTPPMCEYGKTYQGDSKLFMIHITDFGASKWNQLCIQSFPESMTIANFFFRQGWAAPKSAGKPLFELRWGLPHPFGSDVSSPELEQLYNACIWIALKWRKAI